MSKETKKIKLVDLTIRKIMEICDKNVKNCSECPLFFAYFNCDRFNNRHKSLTDTYDREKLLKDEVELDE